ncbi:hypothetical protein ES707_22331 [subsurface metagenome]
MNNWKNDKRNLTKKTQAIVDGLGKSFFKEETIQWLGKRPPKERIDLIERIFEKGQEASKSEKYVLIAGLYEILTNHRILPIDPFKQEMVRIPFDVLLTQIEPVLEEKYAYFDELIKQTLTENPVGTGQETNKDELRKVGVAKEFVSVVSEVLKLISNADDLNSTLRSKQMQNLAAKITVLGQDCGLLEEHHKVGLDAGSYYHQQYVYDTCLYPEEIGEFEWSVPNELRLLREKAKLFVNKAPAETGQKSKPAEEPSKEAKNVFKKDGDFWQVAYQSNDTTTIKDSKGMSYIARLLEKPNEPIAALSLANPKSDTKLMIQGKAVENDTVSSDSGKPQEIIDKDTLQSCQKRIIDIENELADAEKNNDLAAQERLEAEKEQILSELNAACNLKGESRSFTDNFVKARKAVTNAIKRALENIKTHSMPLYQHLDNSIQRGIDFAYKPDRQTNWQL